jgi:hypothetical protein
MTVERRLRWIHRGQAATLAALAVAALVFVAAVRWLDVPWVLGGFAVLQAPAVVLLAGSCWVGLRAGDDIEGAARALQLQTAGWWVLALGAAGTTVTLLVLASTVLVGF